MGQCRFLVAGFYCVFCASSSHSMNWFDVTRPLIFILLGYRSQSPACPSPVFGRNPSSSSSSSSSSALLRAVSWPGGKTPKSPGDQGEGDDGQATRRQLSDPPHSKQQFQSLATDVINASKCEKAASKNTGIKSVRQWCPIHTENSFKVADLCHATWSKKKWWIKRDGGSVNKEKRCWICHAESVSLLMRVEPVNEFCRFRKSEVQTASSRPHFLCRESASWA